MKTKIDYVVARKWDVNKPVPGNLSIYTFASEVQRGTLDEAKEFLEYVQQRRPEEEWDIYRVRFEKLTVVS